MNIQKNSKWDSLKRLPTDYIDYGGNIERWKLIDLDYPDCSSGCKWFAPLYDQANDSRDCDWGVCTNPKSPRAGLLTWEHQAGFQCFEHNEEEDDDNTR
jgi:hypothetical protein